MPWVEEASRRWLRFGRSSTRIHCNTASKQGASRKRTPRMSTRVCRPETGGRTMFLGSNQGILHSGAERQAKKKP